MNDRMNVRIQGRKIRQDLRKTLQVAVRVAANSKCLHFPPVHAFKLLLDMERGGDDDTRILYQKMPGVGQFHGVGIPDKKLFSQFLFQRTDLMCYSGLCYIQPLCTSRKIQCFGYRQKASKLKGVHLVGTPL